MHCSRLALSLLLPALSCAQQVGTQQAEYHPPFSSQKCSSSGCSAEDGSLVLDSNWRWIHSTSGSTNCYDGSSWNKELCPDVETCTANCALEGVSEDQWSGTYGIHAESDSVKLDLKTDSNIGSRIYLLESDEKYKVFKLLNQEFTFDVDVSQLPCGLNGALYMVEMPADGGLSKYSTNKAGAKYGTGYCDAQCPHDIKFINGEANLEGWEPSGSSTGVGKYGTCCTEMDLWESNKMSTQLTPHACSVIGQTRCSGTECGDNSKGERYNGVCDKDGCDFNPFRVGDEKFWGEGSDFTIDTTKKVTVVTQFHTSDGTAAGDLVEIKRFYVQDGKVINNTVASYGNFNSISEAQCTAQKSTFTEQDYFKKKGGLKAMGEALRRGMVLVMSLWDDKDVGMIWLDAKDPYPVPAGKKGANRGTCAQDSGDPATVEEKYPDASVTYSNVKYGDIGSTFPSGPQPPGPSPSGCPGGSLTTCMSLCPSNPPAAYKACVSDCAKRCPNRFVEKDLL